jgi:hypothetical protein
VDHLLSWVYLAGWPIATIIAIGVSHRLHDNRFRPPPTLWVSVVAGAVWPVLALGLLQCGVVAMVFSHARGRCRNPRESDCAGDNPDSGIHWTEGDAKWGIGSRS